MVNTNTLSEIYYEAGHGQLELIDIQTLELGSLAIAGQLEFDY